MKSAIILSNFSLKFGSIGKHLKQRKMWNVYIFTNIVFLQIWNKWKALFRVIYSYVSQNVQLKDLKKMQLKRFSLRVKYSYLIIFLNWFWHSLQFFLYYKKIFKIMKLSVFCCFETQKKEIEYAPYLPFIQFFISYISPYYCFIQIVYLLHS